MRAPDRFEFTVRANEQYDAMLAASQALTKGRNGLRSAAITITLTILSGLGGMAFVTALATWLDVSPAWWVMIGWFGGGALYLGSFKLLYREVARLITKRPLHQMPQALMFDEVGVTYEAGPATWVTPWPLIDSVIETRRTITIVVAGIAFGLPKSAVGDVAASDTLVADIQAQIDSNRRDA